MIYKIYLALKLFNNLCLLSGGFANPPLRKNSICFNPNDNQ